MKTWHVGLITMLIVLAVGYFLGKHFPAVFDNILPKG
jgi:hypothetical protein